jgi:hypothetical protein
MAERTNMWTTLTPALIGLLGVLVGATISTGATYWLAVRKETTDLATEKTKRSTELKTAARLIADELLAGSVAAAMLVEKRRWTNESIKLPLVAWERDKGIIAREVPYGDWNAIAIAAMAVEQFRDFAPPGGRGHEASDALVETGKPVLRDIRAGLEALKPYANYGLEPQGR